MHFKRKVEMKVTTYFTECRRKAAGQSPLPVKLGSEPGSDVNAYLCSRLRDKKLDLKVRTDILAGWTKIRMKSL